MKKEWLNVYYYRKEFRLGKDLYFTPEEATTDLYEKTKSKYRHTINIKTGEIKVMEIK